jgi:cardiolipin synthase
MAGLLYAAPPLGSTAAERFLALSIAGARRTLYITNAYFAPDDNFVGLLTQAARRGVDVSRRRASRNVPGGSGWARRWPSS